ncbi:MAG: citrate/2-methylcitrate synthase [Acidobacteriota bacterium]
MKPSPLWLDAGAAAAKLGVSRATLYAYVSRGLIRSQPLPGSSRARGYARDDVERLLRRAEARRDPAQAAAHALEWGIPVLESAITFIDGRSLYYRSHDAVSLSRSRSLAEVASLIWTGEFGHRFGTPKATMVQPSLPRDAAFVARAQALLAAAASDDPGAVDLRAPGVAHAGWRMLHLLTGAAIGWPARRPKVVTIDGQLARAWRTGPDGAGVVRAVLILCADHELNVSSFTARCVASAGSTPYSVVIAGLSALEGFRHGGAGARVEAMLDAIQRESAHERRGRHLALRRTLEARMRRGETIGGFGHPLYPDGDPRARALLDLLQQHCSGSDELRFVNAFVQAAASVVGEPPNLDFALAAVSRVLRLPSNAPLMLFAIGRTIGWIGQAIEQYATGQLIRPRARYVGPMPSTSGE